MAQLDFHVRVEIKAGETNRLNVVGEGTEKESLGALIGRKGERLSALQHLVNLLLSKKVGEWTRILVDVEDYRGRRERQLRDLANRAAERVLETGKMLQLEPMPALERRWIHLALRDHDKVATQSIGEEPNRRVVVLPRELSANPPPGNDGRPSLARAQCASLPLWGVANDIGALNYHVGDGVTVTPGCASIARPGVISRSSQPLPSSAAPTTNLSARQKERL